ncbi:unnamed protein product [Caretta caretta]
MQDFTLEKHTTLDRRTDSTEPLHLPSQSSNHKLHRPNPAKPTGRNKATHVTGDFRSPPRFQEGHKVTSSLPLLPRPVRLGRRAPRVLRRSGIGIRIRIRIGSALRCSSSSSRDFSGWFSVQLIDALLETLVYL